MELKAFVCPQCGASLTVESSDVNIAKCPKCGSSIHIKYEKNENDNGRRDFVTADGIKVDF